jgi:hypothetical protein
MGFNRNVRAGGKSEVAEMLAGGKRQDGTGMELDEALGIVLEVARNQQYDDVGDFEFEWTADHSEACGVVDNLLYNISKENDNV